jgi:predicted nuclease of predicted toxin-antitoxin system
LAYPSTSQDISPDIIGKQTLAALSIVQAELQAGDLLTIELDRTRLRLLPLE